MMFFSHGFWDALGWILEGFWEAKILNFSTFFDIFARKRLPKIKWKKQREKKSKKVAPGASDWFWDLTGESIFSAKVPAGGVGGVQPNNQNPII